MNCKTILKLEDVERSAIAFRERELAEQERMQEAQERHRRASQIQDTVKILRHMGIDIPEDAQPEKIDEGFEGFRIGRLLVRFSGIYERPKWWGPCACGGWKHLGEADDISRLGHNLKEQRAECVECERKRYEEEERKREAAPQPPKPATMNIRLDSPIGRFVLALEEMVEHGRGEG